MLITFDVVAARAKKHGLKLRKTEMPGTGTIYGLLMEVDGGRVRPVAPELWYLDEIAEYLDTIPTK